MTCVSVYSVVKEPPTRTTGRTTNLGGAERDRTADPLVANQVLSQLSYSPLPCPCYESCARSSWRRMHAFVQHEPDGRSQMVGLDRIELSTSRLSGVRSNHLSYRPIPNYGPLQVSLRRSCVEEVTLAICVIVSLEQSSLERR